MSNSSNQRAFGSSAKSKRKEINLDLSTAQSMLPLVRSIVKDIVESQQTLSELEPVQDNLDRHRRDLVWAERERRYHVHESISAAERKLREAVSELGTLGVAILDTDQGRVGFPTKINGRPALFSWQPGEENVGYWSYEEEELRRPIPSEWLNGKRIKGNQQ